VAEIAGADDSDLGKSYRAHGDLGDMAEHLLLKRPGNRAVPLKQVAQTFDQLPNLRTSAQKMALIKALFEPMSAGEIKYTIKIVTGDLRIGLKESLVEEAIAKAFDRPLDAVRRANMLTGDIGKRCGAPPQMSWLPFECDCFNRLASCWRRQWKPRMKYCRTALVR